jgi:ribose transport system permease protein
MVGRELGKVERTPAEAARLAGISLTRIQIAVYGLNGLLVGIAAVMFTGRIQASTAQSGVGLELQAIAAVLLGGVSYAGGAGSVVGALVGALLIGVVDNALDLRGVNDFWQGAVTGVILVTAVWLDRFRRRS